MKRKTLVNLLIVLLLLAGAGVMLFPKLSDVYYRWEASQEIAQYNQVSEAEQADYSDLWAAAEAYNRQLAETGAFSVSVTPEEREKIEQLLNPLGTGMMGYIDIPKISVHLPIYQGIEERALQAGAGFWLGTSLPTGGESTHCVLTAHNGLVRAKMFTDLDQLEVGDTFTLSILDRVLTYQVDQILVTLPDEFEPLEIVEGEDYVTLYTCTPYGVNSHRLLVRGTRIPTPEEPEAASPVQAAVEGGLGIPVEFLLGAAALLAVLAAVLVLRARKQRRLQAKKKEEPGHEDL